MKLLRSTGRDFDIARLRVLVAVLDEDRHVIVNREVQPRSRGNTKFPQLLTQLLHIWKPNLNALRPRAAPGGDGHGQHQLAPDARATYGIQQH